MGMGVRVIMPRAAVMVCVLVHLDLLVLSKLVED
jgi:hypothetical protein